MFPHQPPGFGDVLPSLCGNGFGEDFPGWDAGALRGATGDLGLGDEAIVSEPAGEKDFRCETFFVEFQGVPDATAECRRRLPFPHGGPEHDNDVGFLREIAFSERQDAGGDESPPGNYEKEEPAETAKDAAKPTTRGVRVTIFWRVGHA